MSWKDILVIVSEAEVDEPALALAEALARGQLDDAYAWARAAVGQAPEFLRSVNTLAVIYLRRGFPQHAERALAHVLNQRGEETAAGASHG